MFQDGSMKTISSASRIRRELPAMYTTTIDPTPFGLETLPAATNRQPHLAGGLFLPHSSPWYHPPSRPQFGNRCRRKTGLLPRSKVTLTHQRLQNTPTTVQTTVRGFTTPNHRFFSHQRLSITASIILVSIAFLLTISSTF